MRHSTFSVFLLWLSNVNSRTSCQILQENGVKKFVRSSGRLCMSRWVSVLCLGHCDGKLQVDLLLPPPVALKGGLLTSMSATFVSCGLACFSSSEAAKNAVKGTAKLKFYPPDTLPINELILVTVSSLESPSSFYVQQGGVYLRYMKKLMNKLQAVYSSSMDPSWEVFCPVPNTPCVAQFSGKFWCRAVIQGF
uniref:Tudor domain-containing protein n=1 Tax=Eptatretus burgeri TaxID=7764 RepID=A0A8C4NDM9_EPTBU